MLQKQKLVAPLLLLVCVAIPAGMIFASVNQAQEEPAYIVIQPRLSGPYGVIGTLTVYQYTGGTWVTRGSITTSGGTITVQPDQNTKFRCRVIIDRSKASSTTQALSYTRVYITITGEVSATLMTGFAGYDLGAEIGWAAEHDYTWTTASRPASGVTYTVTLEFQMYY